MTDRRRRDGEQNPDDGTAPAAGPRSKQGPTGRRRDERTAEPIGPTGGEPRVHGAWTTPAVVVRRPDGSVVTPDEARKPPGARSRVRPRRIPGAPGSVRLRASLVDVADERVERRRRRDEGASGPLPPRPPRRVRDTPETGTAAGPPSLRPVWGKGSRASVPDGAASRGTVRDRDGGGRKAGRGPSPTRPAAPRRHRVREVLAGLSFDHLLPGDDESRQRRASFLRRAGTRLTVGALLALAVYGVFPIRTWIDQRAATDRARERLEVFQRENELLAEEKRDLNTNARIEEEAREMGMVLPREESYRILPAPTVTGAPPADTTTTETEPDG